MGAVKRSPDGLFLRFNLPDAYGGYMKLKTSGCEKKDYFCLTHCFVKFRNGSPITPHNEQE
jgi:hypothetical protein